jgi:serine/threonine protein kinase
MAFYCIHCRSEIAPNYKACPFCGEPITDFLRRHLETPIDGKYKILARLGVGGMGEVYKVVHVDLNAIRVIKLMRAAIASDPGAHERFLREARLATRINHPNVGTLFDFSTLEDGSRYMVWEFIEGINLHELMEERGPLSPRYAAKLAVQALQGLEAIHRAGIVHRDVSPENLMITRDTDGDERVKIIDLGIAKQWGDEGDNKTKTGMFVGKWKYCSPEHLGMLPEGQRIDGRADIYSFGIVLYEMLTGAAPFQADTPHGYLMLHASERPRSLRELNPSVKASPELETVLLRALEKDRTKRFSSAREFAQALEKLLPSLAESPGEPIPVTKAAAPTAVDRNAPTVMTAVSSAAETVQTVSLDAQPTVMTEIGVSRPQMPMMRWAIAAVVVIAIGAGTVAMWRKNPEPAQNVASATPARASIVVPATGRVAINAYPWGNITAIRNAATGETVQMPESLVTPAPIELSAGRYEVTLANPAFKQPITKTVEIKAGTDATLNVQFTDPAKAPLPEFLGASR